MDLKDNGKDTSSTACKGDDSASHDEKHAPNLAENFAKAVLMWLDDLIEDAGITEEEWKHRYIYGTLNLHKQQKSKAKNLALLVLHSFLPNRALSSTRRAILSTKANIWYAVKRRRYALSRITQGTCFCCGLYHWWEGRRCRTVKKAKKQIT